MSSVHDINVYSSSQRNQAMAGLSSETFGHSASQDTDVEFSGLVSKMNDAASENGSKSNGKVDVDEFLGFVNDGAPPDADKRNAFTADEADDEDEELFELEEDIYSLMFIAEYFSTAFGLGLCVLAIQLSTLSLAIIDMLKDPPNKNNPYKIPINVDIQVAVSQFLSLIIAVISQDDILTSLSALLVTRYDEAVTERHPCATHNKWILTNLLRLTEGLLLVVQSSDVLEIFMNFAALEFISEIDNMVFFLVKAGYFGGHLQFAAKCTNAITLPRAKHGRLYLLWCSMTVILGLLIAGWSVVRRKQTTGYYLHKQSSHSVSVIFGDEFYIIPENTALILSEKKQNLTEIAPFNASDPPILFYSYFSGTYKAGSFQCDKQSCFNKRLVYYERDYEACKSDPRCGKFYYCDAVQAWVFTIDALGDAVKEKLDTPGGKCQWGWLLRSPQTSSYKLQEVPTSGWTVWTGIITTALSLSITGDECSEDFDCALHGSCSKNASCECNAGWEGTKCNVKKSYCGAAIWLKYGETSKDFDVVGPYDLLLNDGGAPIVAYNRPVYGMKLDPAGAEAAYCDGEGVYELFVYVGQRWCRTKFCDSQVKNIQKGTDDLSALHPYWDNFFGSLSDFSDITESYTGLDISWNFLTPSTQETDSNIPFYNAVAYGEKAYLTCLDVDCVNSIVRCRLGDCKNLSIDEFNLGNLAIKVLQRNLTVNNMLRSVHRCGKITD